MIIYNSKFTAKTIDEILKSKRTEIEEEISKCDKILNKKVLLDQSLQGSTATPGTSDKLLIDLINTLGEYGIKDTARLKDVLECVYLVLTV